MQEFFKELYGECSDGFIEFRCIDRQTRDIKRFWTPIGSTSYPPLVELDQAGYDCYFGVGLRSTEGGSRKGDVGVISSLWADIDHREEVESFPEPTILVSSGRGVHAYWCLVSSIDPRDEDIGKRVEHLLRAIARRNMGDVAATDLPRILRVPGTHNHKAEELQPVTWKKVSDHRYTLEQLEQLLEVTEDGGPEPAEGEVDWSIGTPCDSIDSLALPEGIRTLIEQGHPIGDREGKYKSRSEADLAVIGYLVRLGLGPCGTRDVFERYPIGAKYREQGIRYLAHTYKKAVQGAARTQNPIEERDGSYYRYRVIHGEAITERISNFTITPNTVLRLPDGQVLHCTVKRGESTSEVFLRRRDLLGWRDLLRSIPLTQAQWLGSDKDVQTLVGHLANFDVPNKKGTKQVGWCDGYFVTATDVWDEQGKVEDPPVIFCPSHVELEKHYRVEEVEDWQLTAQSLPNLHAPATIWPLIAWFSLAPLSERIYKALGHFPLLLLWGTAGSGKTTLLSTLWRLFGCTGDLRTCSRTIYPLIRELATTNALPLCLDEYRPTDMGTGHVGRFHTLLRSAYNRQTESRGRVDGNSPVESYPLTAPIAVAGEIPFTDPALVERSLIVSADAGWIYSHQESAAILRELSSCPPILWPYLRSIWSFELGSKDSLEPHRAKVRQVLHDRVPDRMVDNFALFDLGVSLFCQFSGTDVPNTLEIIKKMCEEAIPSDREDLRPESLVDQWMRTLNNMVSADRMQEGRDYIVEGTTLYLHTELAVDLTHEWLRNHGGGLPSFTGPSIKKQLREHAMMQTYVMEAGKGVRKRFPLGNHRCSLFHLQKMEEMLGIPADSWQRRPQP